MLTLRNVNAVLHSLLDSVVSVDMARAIPVFLYMACFVVLPSGNLWNLSVPRVIKFRHERDFRRQAEPTRWGEGEKVEM